MGKRKPYTEKNPRPLTKHERFKPLKLAWKRRKKVEDEFERWITEIGELKIDI